MHFLLLGLILGFGAAIPIGPVNLEIIRRNLNFGTKFGLSLGVGASSADLTYLVLLSMGALSIFNHQNVLAIMGIMGSLVMVFFAYKALTAIPSDTLATVKVPSSLLRNGIAGYIITLLNPYTILFWASVSSQLTVTAANNTHHGLILAGAGLIMGTISWILFLNILLHYTRKTLSANVTHRLNQIGGLILIGFAGYSGYHAINTVF